MGEAHPLFKEVIMGFGILFAGILFLGLLEYCFWVCMGFGLYVFFDESLPSSTGVESEIASNEDVGSSSTNLDFSEISNDDNISSTGQVEEEITLVENKRIHIKVLENEVKKSSQLLPRPENKRSKPVIDCSTNGSRKVAFLSTYHSEAPSACTKKPRPTTVPSTFSFKCDERAAKRKEFFQKLEQRCKVNETQTIKLQPKLKDKIRSEKNRLRCSTALEAQASTSETKAQSNNVQKHVPKVNGEMPSADEATSDHQRLMDRLQVYDLVELKVSGDGNCQFRSLSDQIYRSSEHHKLVREQVVRQLKCHPELYAAYVPMAYHEYLKKISMAGEWGDHVTLQAAADAFGVKIFVLTSFKDTCYIEILPFAQKSKRIIFLSFWAEVHYNSLYPEGELPTMESTKKKKWWMLGS